MLRPSPLTLLPRGERNRNVSTLSLHRGRTIALTTFALIAFAANSLLCRLALGGQTIDAASFTTIRLVSGALTLLLVSRIARGDQQPASRGNWLSAAMLFLYAIAFSFAYLSLSTGTGALILFGAVQATMILSALRSGERPHSLEWIGLVAALGGLIYLVFPGLSAPSPIGSLLMTTAGIAWGVYSLRGRGSANPLADTTGNFVRSVPLVLVVGLVAAPQMQISSRGVLFAILSGAVASGIGYAVWYAALPRMTATRAATVQLSVPILAATGGVAFLSESISLRLILASIMILGGVLVSLAGRQRVRVKSV